MEHFLNLLNFNYFNISLLLGGLIALVSSSLAISTDSRNPENRTWFLSNLFAAIWSFGYLTMITTKDYTVALNSDMILHAAATFTPLFYFGFALSITKRTRQFKYQFVLASLIAVLLLLIVPLKSYVLDVIPKFKFNFVPDAGPLYIIFTIYFFVLVIYSLILIFISLVKEKDKIERTKLSYIFFASIFGFAGGGSVFFLTFNINIPPYPLILFSLYPIVITYAIIRHHLFNVKLVATETFVFILWGFLLFRTIISTGSDQIINGLLFIGTVIVGILLIRGMIKEVQTRERIEALAKDLSSVNEQLEAANVRLKELDRQKSEFVSIASHQLRSPLTAMKGYSSMLLEGSFGDISDKARDAIDRIFQSSQRLAIIIDDFLNISRIEQGRMQYEFSTVDIDKLTHEVIKEMEGPIKNAGLKISYRKETTGKVNITADYGKIRQVLTNIIDNAIKYTPKGGINVTLRKDDDTRRVLLEVSDTGIGIEPDVMPKLFEKFSRAEDAGKTNIQGTGLGLFVAKEIMKAHKGSIWVDSEGKGKGSTFYLSFMGE